MEIVYETESGYKVREITPRSACADCLAGWVLGTLTRPKDGGIKCLHTHDGTYQVGTVGPRGGWWPIGPVYRTFRSARRLANVLDSEAPYQR